MHAGYQPSMGNCLWYVPFQSVPNFGELLYLLPFSTKGNTSNVEFCHSRIEACIRTYVKRQNYLNKLSFFFFLKSVKLAQPSNTSLPTLGFVTSGNLSEKKLLPYYDPTSLYCLNISRWSFVLNLLKSQLSLSGKGCESSTMRDKTCELHLSKTSALVFCDMLSSFLTFIVDVQYIFMFHLAVLLLLR